METEKKCPWCGDVFTPEHGNETYCSTECQNDSRRHRQKQKRDPIAPFIPVLMENHAILHDLYKIGKKDLTPNEIGACKLDLSLCRYLQPPPPLFGKLLLDFGIYILVTDTNFLIFKIETHDTLTSIETK
jgi:hypothetical protein